MWRIEQAVAGRNGQKVNQIIITSFCVECIEFDEEKMLTILWALLPWINCFISIWTGQQQEK